MSREIPSKIWGRERSRSGMEIPSRNVLTPRYRGFWNRHWKVYGLTIESFSFFATWKSSALKRRPKLSESGWQRRKAGCSGPACYCERNWLAVSTAVVPAHRRLLKMRRDLHESDPWTVSGD